MNPHTDQSSSAGKEGAIPAVKVTKRPAEQSGGRLNLESYLGKPEQIQKMKIPLYAALGLLVVVDFFVHRDHAAFIWDSIPGFSAVYALIATIVIVFVSKFLGLGLMKREDYYD